MKADISSRLITALKASEFWLPATKDNGRSIYPLKCPECGKPEGWAYSKKPWVISCNRQSQCGRNTRTRDLFPEILTNVERDFKATAKDPHRPAAAYLQMRGITESLSGLKFEYWSNVRGTGRGAVMFPVDDTGSVWNGRIINPPPDHGKSHNKGSSSGVFWKHPGKTYDSGRETFICEGVIDALSLIEMGFQAVAVLAAGQDPDNIDLTQFKNIVFAFDNDPAGRRALKKWWNYYSDQDGYKIGAVLNTAGDWNDLLTSRGKEKAVAYFQENRAEFEFQARLSLAESAKAYAELYYDFKGMPPGLFEFDQCYYYGAQKKGGKGSNGVFAYRVSNFILSVDHFQYDVSNFDEPVFRYHLRVKPRNGRQASFTVSAGDLSSSNSLTTMFLTRGRCLWEGDRRPSVALARRIVESPAPVVRQLQTVGLDKESGFYVFRTFAVDPSGRKVLPDRRGVFRIGRSSFIRPVSYHNLLKPSQGASFKKIYRLILSAWGERGAAAVAWMVGSWFVSSIKRELGFFPFLSFFGDTATGKSCLTRVLNALQCIDEEGLPMRRVNTMKGEIRRLAQRSSLFQALLEANSSENVRFDLDGLLTLFNQAPLQVRALKSNDIQTQEIPFRSALLFVQNREPFRTRAQMERICSVEFLRDHQSDETSKAFDHLVKIPPAQLAVFFPAVMKHRVQIEGGWIKAFQKARSFLLDCGDARIVDNHALILAFHNIVSSIIAVDYDLGPYARRITALKHKVCSHRPADLADFIFDIVFELAGDSDDSEKAATCIDYREDTGRLFFSLKGVWELSEKKRIPIRAQIKDVQRALREHPGFLESNKAHRFRSGVFVEVRKAWVFDVSKIAGDSDHEDGV